MPWRLKLEEYDYKIIYKAGKSNINADALSRNPIRNDERMYNVQSKEKRKITTKKIRMASQKNIRRKRNSKYYMNII